MASSSNEIGDGKKIDDEPILAEPADYAKSILLPFDEIFRNLKNAKRFAIDIGK